ncbi:MAG: hypothetical protein AB7O28_08935 [Vicinamibacterales bacterium]
MLMVRPAGPAPAAATAITAIQLAPSICGGTGSATTVARSDHTHSDIFPPAVSAPVSGRCSADGMYSGGPPDGQFDVCTSLTMGVPKVHSVLLIAQIGWESYQTATSVKGECQLERNGVLAPGATVTMGETVKTTEEGNAGTLLNRRLNWAGVTAVSGPVTGTDTCAVACRERVGDAQFNKISLSAIVAK